jgi:hypothetical protein
VTVPADTYAAALRHLARLYVGEPNALAFATDAHDAGFTDELHGAWLVTVLDGSRHRTFRTVEKEVERNGDRFLDFALAETHDYRICAECGEDLGVGAYAFDDRTRTDRGVTGSRGLDGCESCVRFVERERAA